MVSAQLPPSKTSLWLGLRCGLGLILGLGVIFLGVHCPRTYKNKYSLKKNPNKKSTGRKWRNLSQ